MNKEAIKLLRLLRSPESIRYAPVIYLDKENKLPLVLDLQLSKDIFTHKSIKPFDLWNFYKDLTQEFQLEHLETYFQLSPLLNHEQSHREMRLEVLTLYKKLEPILIDWLKNHVSELEISTNLDTKTQLAVVEDWVLKLLCHLFETSLKISHISPRWIPDDFFYLLPSKEKLIATNLQLGKIITHIQDHYPTLSIREIVTSLTVVIMARQALIFSIFERLYSNNEFSFEASTPVNIIARTVTNDCVIHGYKFVKNQTIYLSPFLVKFFHPKSDLAFGWGPHQCPGKNLSLMIEYQITKTLSKSILFKKLSCKIVRDLSSTLNP